MGGKNQEGKRGLSIFCLGREVAESQKPISNLQSTQQSVQIYALGTCAIGIYALGTCAQGIRGVKIGKIFRQFSTKNADTFEQKSEFLKIF